MAFYGGFADLMVTAAMGDWDAADSIEIMIGLEDHIRRAEYGTQ
jgi:hypothetical protein